MPDDRVKVAGVWMSREEARIVAEERQRIFGRLIFSRRFLPVAVIVSGMAFFAAASITLASHVPGARYLAGLVTSSGIVVCACVIVAYRYMVEVRQQQRIVMNRLGRRVCLKCAYEIANDSPYGEVCPECGAEYVSNDSSSRGRE